MPPRAETGFQGATPRKILTATDEQASKPILERELAVLMSQTRYAHTRGAAPWHV